MKMKIRALPVYIYRNKFGDCSNGGISSKFDDAFLVCENGPYSFDSDDLPENLLILDEIRGRKFARPYRKTDPGHVGWMFGGSLIYTSDSRFPSEYPVSLHDRQESQREYDILSR